MRRRSYSSRNGGGLLGSSSSSLSLCRCRGSRCGVAVTLFVLVCCAVVGTMAVLIAPSQATYYFPAFTRIPAQQMDDAPTTDSYSTHTVTLSALPHSLPHSSSDALPAINSQRPSPPPPPPQPAVTPFSPPAPLPTPTPDASPTNPSPLTPSPPSPSSPFSPSDFRALLGPLPVVSSYHRCDLLDWHHEMPDAAHTWERKPEWNYHDTGQCVQYSLERPASDWVKDEIHAYRDLQHDQAYFTVHHVRHVEEDGQDVGGHLYVLQENCYRRPQLIHTDRHAATLIDQRFGPTALELRINGSELHTSPMRFVDPSRYSQLHLAIMRAGTHRTQVVPGEGELTGQQKVDLEWLPKTIDWPGPRDARGHRPEAMGVKANLTSRVYGVDVCMYEGDYAVATTGVYEVRVLLLNVDYEDISQVGHRRMLHRAQNAVVYRSPPRPVSTSPRIVWPHPPHHSIHPLLNAMAEPPLTRIAISSDDNIHLHIEHDPRMLSPLVNLSSTMVDHDSPNPSIGDIPIFSHPGYDGRWVNASGARRVEGVRNTDPMPLPVWWDSPHRRRVLREWSDGRPPFSSAPSRTPLTTTTCPTRSTRRCCLCPPHPPPPPPAPCPPPYSCRAPSP